MASYWLTNQKISSRWPRNFDQNNFSDPKNFLTRKSFSTQKHFATQKKFQPRKILTKIFNRIFFSTNKFYFDQKKFWIFFYLKFLNFFLPKIFAKLSPNSSCSSTWSTYSPPRTPIYPPTHTHLPVKVYLEPQLNVLVLETLSNLIN